ncbi:hypothetical protein CR51_09820 [Caballeronia megalochromosomata]|nr:hypothetical protein CR51_09820 [Caballeronia megalochromosomata]
MWWLREFLITTCTTISVPHGTNDGQKSICLTMLTIIGLVPPTYALNPEASGSTKRLSQFGAQAIPPISNTATM